MLNRHHISSSRQSLLEARAWAMRRNPTASEAALFAALRGRRLGVSFRRQVVIGERIVDLLAPSLRLVIEVDGGYHEQRRGADARRDAELSRACYRVLHLNAELIMRHLALAVERVVEEIERLRR